MKKNNFTLVIFLLIGLLAGTIVGKLLTPVEWLWFLTATTDIDWQPRADLQFLQYDLHVLVKLNLMGILGMAAAFWIYRKL